MNEIIVATGNRNKLAELQTIASRFSLQLLSPHEAAQRFGLSPAPDVDETGATFEENALLKAEAFCRWSGRACLGDDSGIEIDALGGRPGIKSARYAGDGATDSDRIEKLLRELAEATRHDPNAGRRGRFRCALALVFPDGTVLRGEGSLEGSVLESPRGTGGFGYDPILYIDELGATLAEIDFAVTCERGFRAKAAMDVFSQLTVE